MTQHEQLFGIIAGWLLPYQKRWLADRSRRRIALKSRQIGWTRVGIGLDAVLEALEFPHRLNIYSNRLSNAKDALGDCADWIEILNHAGANLNVDVGREVIRFGNGSKICALPATSQAARGPRGSVYVDEASTIRQEQEFYTAVQYNIAGDSRYRISYISTPRGARGEYYETWRAFEQDREASAWSGHRVDVRQAIAQGLPRNLDELVKESKNPEQELFCSFDAGGNFFQLDLLLAAELVRRGRSRGQAVLGVDLAKIHDLTAFVGIEDSPTPHAFGAWMVPCTNYRTQRHLLFNLQQQLDARVVFIDATKHPAFVDEYAAMYRNHEKPPLIVGKHTTNQYKARVIPSLRDALEASGLTADWSNTRVWVNEQWVQSDESVMLDDALNVHQGHTPSGLPSYTSPRNDQGHGDSFAALYLAWDALAALHVPAAALPKAPQHKPRRRKSRSRLQY